MIFLCELVSNIYSVRPLTGSPGEVFADSYPPFLTRRPPAAKQRGGGHTLACSTVLFLGRRVTL
jgi:hypothetical protein